VSRAPTFAVETPANQPAAEDDDLAAVLARPEGRRVLRRLLDRSGLFAASLTADPLLLAYREGGRALGLALLERIAAVAPDRLAAVLRPEADDA